MPRFAFFLQVSAIEQDIIEVDPDTKEMLKVLVSDCSDITCTFSLPAKAARKHYLSEFLGISVLLALSSYMYIQGYL